MTGVDQLLEAALYTALTAGTALITDLGGTAIYNRIAPPSADLPYVIFQWQGGGDENLTPSRMLNTVYTVKAVAATLTAAHTVNGDIDSLLHNQTLTVSGWTNFWMAREGRVSYHEVEPNGTPVYHEGGLYRVRLGQ